jgi:pimeloyl-ACP methyl ester carboxylesterase
MNWLRLPISRLCAVALMLCFGVLPAAQAQYVDCLPAETPSFAKPKSANRESVVVFIHGLHGDGGNTWTATGTFGGRIAAWPCLLLADREVFRDSNVYLAEYRSKAGRTNPSVGEAAQDIAKDLDTQGVLAHTHITFVAHSMGGIVLARMLTDTGLITREQKSRVRLVVFLGTPALPTEAAAICGKFGVNAQCQEMSDTGKMAALWQAWDRLEPRLPAWCVAEGANMTVPPWLRVVPVESAHRPCRVADLRSVAQGLDHSDVVKPESIEKRPHRDLRHAFSTCVRPRLTQTSGEASAADQRLAEAGSRWFYELKDRLLAETTDWTVPLEHSLASTTEVKRFWYPADNNPSFDADRYDRLGTGAFVQAVRQALPDLLPPAEFAWIAPVERIGQRVPDSAMDTLLRRFRDAGGLRADDVVLALKPRPEVEGQFLLLLRPGSSNQPAGAPGAAFGAIGIAVIPKPVEGCRA